jgi:carbon monoxide dehydrogenase subunit G
MQMAGQQRIDAPREVVWAALTDPSILRQCIPGCESVERVSDTELHAVATATFGEVQARFKSKVTLSACDPPHSCRIAGESQAGTAGFAQGGADLHLESLGAASTLLKYGVDATLGGNLAQLGERLIDQTAQTMANEFCARLNMTVSRSTPKAELEATTEPAAHLPAVLCQGFWLATTLALITLALYAMALI